MRAAGLNALLFQFHKGTIRTPKPKFSKGSSTGFQFHKGTIRTLQLFKVKPP